MLACGIGWYIKINWFYIDIKSIASSSHILLYNGCVRVKQNPDKAEGSDDEAYLDIGNYNVPQSDGNNNMLGSLRYGHEQLYSVTGRINSPQNVFWINTTQEWLHLAADLEVCLRMIY